MQQSIIRPKQAAALFGVSLSTLWNWNNPKHRLYRPDNHYRQIRNAGRQPKYRRIVGH